MQPLTPCSQYSSLHIDVLPTGWYDLISPGLKQNDIDWYSCHSEPSFPNKPKILAFREAPKGNLHLNHYISALYICQTLHCAWLKSPMPYEIANKLHNIWALRMHFERPLTFGGCIFCKVCDKIYGIPTKIMRWCSMINVFLGPVLLEWISFYPSCHLRQSSFKSFQEESYFLTLFCA